MITQRRMFRFTRRIIAVYLFLLVLAVPWYWPPASRALLFGLPAWAVVAVLVSLLVSAFTAWVLLRYRWPDDEDSGEQ